MQFFGVENSLKKTRQNLVLCIVILANYNFIIKIDVINDFNYCYNAWKMPNHLPAKKLYIVHK